MRRLAAFCSYIGYGGSMLKNHSNGFVAIISCHRSSYLPLEVDDMGASLRKLVAMIRTLTPWFEPPWCPDI